MTFWKTKNKDKEKKNNNNNNNEKKNWLSPMSKTMFLEWFEGPSSEEVRVDKNKVYTQGQMFRGIKQPLLFIQDQHFLPQKC